MNTVRFYETIKTRRVSRVPGDNLLELTRAATDVDGREWPARTTVRSLSAGRDNVAQRDYRDVTVIG